MIVYIMWLHQNCSFQYIFSDEQIARSFSLQAQMEFLSGLSRLGGGSWKERLQIDIKL